MSNEQKLREAFEKWAREQFYSGLACPSDTWSEDQKTYNDPAHHMAFCAFKAISKALATTEPAVNQQLTTELDEREAFEREMKKRLTSPLSFDRHEANTNEYAYLTTAVAWYAWQARAAMAKGVKG